MTFPPPPDESSRRTLPLGLRGPRSDLIRETFLKSLPGLYAHYQSVAGETLQSVVWVVGLATGLLAYTSLAPGGLAWMDSDVRRDLLVFLLGCVILGVLYRLAINEIDLLSRHQQWEQLTRLSVLDASVQELWYPDELSGVEGVINALSDGFGVDGSFLRSPPYDLAMAREYYRSRWQYQIQKEREALDSLGELMAASAGEIAPGISRMFADEGGLDEVRSRGALLIVKARFAAASYLGALVCFLGALILLVVAAVAR